VPAADVVARHSQDRCRVHGAGWASDDQPVECAFDYRIAAKQQGYEDVRLEQAIWPE